MASAEIGPEDENKPAAPPGLKKTNPESLEVGALVRATVKPDDEECEGVVYTVDPVTKTLVLYSRIDETEECAIRLIPKHSISKLEVLSTSLSFIVVTPSIGEPTEERAKFGSPQPIDDKELEKRERSAVEATERAIAELNPNAPKPGQAVFNTFAKTMDCTWNANAVVVLDQVQIDPPYEPENCQSLDGDQAALDRIRRILANVRKKWRRADDSRRA